MSRLTVTRIHRDDRSTLGLHLDYLGIPWGFARVGYRVVDALPDEGGYRKERALAELTLPSTTGQFRFRNRTRVELRWISGIEIWFDRRTAIELIYLRQNSGFTSTTHVTAQHVKFVFSYRSAARLAHIGLTREGRFVPPTWQNPLLLYKLTSRYRPSP